MADYQLRKFTFIRYDDNDQEQTGMISMPGNPNTGGNIGF